MQVSETGIKVIIILAAIAIAIGVSYLPSSSDKTILEQAVDGVIEKEVGCEA
jgi:hypothetical protein